MLVKDFVMMDKGNNVTYDIRDVKAKGLLLDSRDKNYTRVIYGKYELYSFEVIGKNKVTLYVS